MKKAPVWLTLAMLHSCIAYADMKPSHCEVDFYGTQQDKLKEYGAIAKNFKQLNSITKWHKILKKEDMDQSLEGGEVKYFYSKKRLEKIVAIYYGEAGKSIVEYYFLNGKISFVYEQALTYNMAINIKGFDEKTSESSWKRSYFENYKLLHQLASDDCGAPWSDEYLKYEESEIKKELKRLLNIIGYGI